MMQAFTKRNAAPATATTEKKNVWGILIQVLIAALTALTGVLTGCNMAG